MIRKHVESVQRWKEKKYAVYGTAYDFPEHSSKKSKEEL